MTRKEQLIAEILDRELAMFLSVPARSPAACQQDPDGFRVVRGAQFSVWSEDTLASYREDLQKAGEQGRNLMTLKYARMEGLVPQLDDDPLVENVIGQIVAIQVEGQTQMIAKYPHLMGRGRPLEQTEAEDGATSFVTYLRGELETYSAGTLALLYRDLSEQRSHGRNMTEAVYLHMVKGLGYESIEEAETAREHAARDGARR